MNEYHKTFEKNAEIKAFDKQHKKILDFNISKYDFAVEKGKLQYCNLELAKQRANRIKLNVINNLDKYLTEFEASFQQKGGKLIWARNKEDAINEILAIVKKYDAKSIVKSKSMITEEIELNHALEKSNCKVFETDLGEFIVQLRNEPPYHIITPAMHLSKENIADLYNKTFNLPENSSPEELTEFTRQFLREKFIQADIGITGANFLIADSGAVCITENEGNALLSFSMPKIHIAITGIEKIIPSIKDLDLFLSLLSTHGTGQNITAYNSIISGSKADKEKDGPLDFYLILLDNGRSELLSLENQREALACIRCGACLNACPVYKKIGGHTYKTPYGGPIGSVISPHLFGLEKYNHLSFASSLCGKCTEVCPVKINIHRLLLINRRDLVNQHFVDKKFKYAIKGYKMLMKHRKWMDMPSAALKNRFLHMFFGKTWGPRRTIPKFSGKSFNVQWKESRIQKL